MPDEMLLGDAGEQGKVKGRFGPFVS